MKIPNLEIAQREKKGSNQCRQMRMLTDQVPGIIYGKGADPVNIRTNEKVFRELVLEGHHMVKVDAGAGERPALIKEVQWDTYGDKVLHFDLRRVELTDRIEVPVPIEFKHADECPGVKAGGTLTRPKKVVYLEVAASDIPDSVICDLVKLELDGHLTFADLELPEGASLVDEATDAVAICPSPKRTEEVEGEEGEGEGEAAEAEADGESKSED